MSSAKWPPFCLGLNVLSIQRLWNDKKKTQTKQTKKTIRFRIWHCHPGNGSIHDDATRQLYLIYSISKVRSELSWDISVDIPDNTTDWLMGVCVTSGGTFKSVPRTASRQAQSAAGKLQLNRPFNWCWMFTRTLPHWSRHVYAVELLEMAHFFPSLRSSRQLVHVQLTVARRSNID